MHIFLPANNCAFIFMNLSFKAKLSSGIFTVAETQYAELFILPLCVGFGHK